MTHSGPHRQYSQRSQPSRANTKDSWLTIDWGERPSPSHLHGVLDQIAGILIRDPKLVEQGKNEWASATRHKRRQAARSKSTGSGTGSSTPARRGTGSSTPQRSRSMTASGRKPTTTTGANLKRSVSVGGGGFLSGLFGAKKANVKPSNGTLRRAMSKPGQVPHHHSSSGSTPRVARRSTTGGSGATRDAPRRPRH